MDPTNETLEQLKAIRGEIASTRIELGTRIEATNQRMNGLNERVHGLNEKFDGLNERFDGLNERFEGLNDRLDTVSRRIVESEMRTTTAIVDLHGTVRDLVDVLRGQHDLRPRVNACERDIEDIKRHLHLV